MDLTFLIAWEWFQWIAIRLALFMALLTLGPSVALIVFDLLFYVLRTTFDSLGGGKISLNEGMKKAGSHLEEVEVEMEIER
jgi:hypothetical protein